ncbi:Uncharacterized protein dnl_63010 [Desulfonema limicola]|uniref:Uncharacterized protein n=1 Tax=Desulfonema limicola TaxID=45656 RepID=A0A975GKK2_9BACT|nr:hypothetical protein [Desulfonema limicola]QTA83878.1 Uncharacterized protein dnl_63010 [Desulfonema limicola]
MTQPAAKLERFDFYDINKLYDELSGNSSLNALGALLAESDFEMLFSGSDNESSSNRYGLKHIIDFYLDFQEKAVSRLCAKARNSPEWIISDARKTCEEINNSAYSINYKIDLIAAKLSDLKRVIVSFPSGYPEAEIIMQDLSTMLQTLINSNEQRGAS